jgi:hypothetical protein
MMPSTYQRRGGEEDSPLGYLEISSVIVNQLARGRDDLRFNLEEFD